MLRVQGDLNDSSVSARPRVVSGCAARQTRSCGEGFGGVINVNRVRI